jgi:FlaA1/EpsC-like NDP-sugar epimerase
MSKFSDKTLLITGGTGSFGHAVLNRFINEFKEIRIFSRDEKKQDDMRHECQVRYPEVAHKIKFYIVDVRNRSTLKAAVRGVDYIFHAAALKQVPSCEFFPMEAVKTNVIGNCHGEKEYETLFTKEEVATAIDMGNDYAVLTDKRDLNYDKCFIVGDTKRATVKEFNSNAA